MDQLNLCFWMLLAIALKIYAHLTVKSVEVEPHPILSFAL
jgi:hypothetical protein